MQSYRCYLAGRRPALSEEQARAQMIERAGIEFDPAVVSVLLTLSEVEEMRSFAKTEESTPSATTDDDWNLFALFMK